MATNVPEGDSKITVEVYTVNNDVHNMVTRLEKPYGYQLVPIQVTLDDGNVVDAVMWKHPLAESNKLTRIVSGDYNVLPSR